MQEKQAASQNHMMKLRSKFLKGGAALLLLCMAAPSFVYAKESTTSSAGSSGLRFCASLDVATQKIAQNIFEKQDKYSSKEKDREARLEEKASLRERNTQGARLDANAKHDKVLTKLSEHATSQNEKSAIEKFRHELDIAIAKRRASVDAALLTFNTESAKLIAARANDIDTATTSLRNRTMKAGNTAKVNCRNGLSGTTVRTRYTRELKNARTQFQSDVASALGRNQDIALLIKNRDVDIKNAVELFKDTLTSLRADLEASLETN